MDGSGPIWLESVSCFSQARLINCTHRGFGVHDCGHSDDAGVRCTGETHRIITGQVVQLSAQFN